jgi:general secretion pathway protein G
LGETLPALGRLFSCTRRALDKLDRARTLSTTMRSPLFLSSNPAVRRSRRAGFTLLEIIVVLAILGLLVGVLVVNVGGNLDRGQQDAARIFVQQTMRTPLVTYRIDMGGYPTTAEGLQALVTPPANRADRWRGPYTADGKLPLDPWGEPYQYRYPGVKNKGEYDLFSKGIDRLPDTEDDIGNW